MAAQCADVSLPPPVDVAGTYKPVAYAELQYGSSQLFTNVGEKAAMTLASTADPFLLTHGLVFACEDLQEGCDGGFRRSSEEVTPCVWHYGGCNWVLYCVDQDDVGLKLVHALRTLRIVHRADTKNTHTKLSTLRTLSTLSRPLYTGPTYPAHSMERLNPMDPHFAPLPPALTSTYPPQVYVIEAEGGVATKIRVTYMETGGPFTSKPYQHSEVNYQVCERV